MGMNGMGAGQVAPQLYVQMLRQQQEAQQKYLQAQQQTGGMSSKKLSTTQIATPTQSAFNTTPSVSANDALPVAKSQEPYTIKCICGYSDDDGLLVAFRQGDYKYVYAEESEAGD